MKSWQVLVNRNVDQTEVRKLLAKHGVLALRPNEVTRRKNGKLCEVELCFVSMGPDNLDTLLAKSKLINDVLPSPVARLC